MGDLKKLKVDELKTYLRYCGLRMIGNKATLIERIQEHMVWVVKEILLHSKMYIYLWLQQFFVTKETVHFSFVVIRDCKLCRCKIKRFYWRNNCQAFWLYFLLHMWWCNKSSEKIPTLHKLFFHINAAEMLCVFLVGIRVKDGGGKAKYRRSTFSIDCTGKSPSCCMLLHDFLAHPSSGCNYWILN